MTKGDSSNAKNSGPGAQQNGATDWRTLHLWQIQPLRDGLVLLAGFGVLWLGYLLSVVTVPILLALALAYLFEPIVATMTRGERIGRPAAALVIIVVAAISILVPIGVGVSFGLVQGVSSAQKLTSHLALLQESVDAPNDEELYQGLPPGFWRQTRDYLVREEKARKGEVDEAATDGAVAPDAEIEGPQEQAEAAFDRLKREGATFAIAWLRANAQGIASAVGKRAMGVGADAIKSVISAITSVGYLLFASFLTAFFFFFFSASYAKVVSFGRQLMPDRHKEMIIGMITKMDRVIAAFIRGRITIAFILAIVYTIGYWLIGAPAPLVLGPLVGLVSLAPYMSGVLGMPGAMLLMLLSPSGVEWQHNWWWILFAPVGVSLIGQALDDYILTPMIQGKSTDMDMPSILFASIAGGVLGGFYGVLLAIPVAACVKILITDLVWPRFQEWTEGRAKDPLPISTGNDPE